MDLQTRPHLVLLLLVVLAFVQRSQGLSCTVCNLEKCSPPPTFCLWGAVIDACDCCTVCGQGILEDCGGAQGHGVCGNSLYCLEAEDLNRPGICLKHGMPIPGFFLAKKPQN
ncbi:single insulin-like growth factor-binding domain protein-1 [Oratosquilla oratoria]|uniref:single insulin-like growth factor-binding domain protein-1 n=1 Tax=Oratosquilla oratoria TaxID=337810 RepID=UPI003F770A1F